TTTSPSRQPRTCWASRWGPSSPTRATRWRGCGSSCQTWWTRRSTSRALELPRRRDRGQGDVLLAAEQVDHHLLVALQSRRNREGLGMCHQHPLAEVEGAPDDHRLVVLLPGDQPPAPVPPAAATAGSLADTVQ